MKYFQINNLKSVSTKCLEKIETDMAGVFCFTSMKIFLAILHQWKIPCKTVNVEGLPDDCEITLIELSLKSLK